MENVVRDLVALIEPCDAPALLHVITTTDMLKTVMGVALKTALQTRLEWVRHHYAGHWVLLSGNSQFPHSLPMFGLQKDWIHGVSIDRTTGIPVVIPPTQRSGPNFEDPVLTWAIIEAHQPFTDP